MKHKFLLVIWALLLFSFQAVSQQGSIKGTVSTSDGKPAEYINVALKSSHRGATTNAKGEFEIKKIEPGTHTLVISSVGLETRELLVEIRANETTVVPGILLAENSEQLEEVEVRGEKV